MTSLVRLIRDRIRGILKDLPPDHSQITDIFLLAPGRQNAIGKQFFP